MVEGENIIITTYVVSLMGYIMSTSTSIRINNNLYSQAKQNAQAEHRTISGQIEFWASVGHAALDNPDLPISFIAESLASLKEPREQAEVFVPQSKQR